MREFSPAVVHFDLTGKCNFNCVHCRGRVSLTTLSKEDTLRILDDVFSHWRSSIQWVELGGGEPLLVPHLEEVIAHIKKHSTAKTLIVTNGSLFSIERAQRLLASGLDRIQFSLDGAKEQTHNRIRRNVRSYQQVLAACGICREIGLSFVLRLSILKYNVEEIEEFMLLAKRLGAAEVGIRGCVYSGNAEQNAEETFIEPEIYGRILRQLPILSERHGIPYFSGDPLALVYNEKLMNRVTSVLGSLDHYGGCMIGISYLYINNDGNVAICPMLNEHVLGDPRKTSIYELWNTHPFFARMRARDLSGKCGRCRYKTICGGCRAQSYWKSKELFGENPICRVNDVEG